MNLWDKHRAPVIGRKSLPHEPPLGIDPSEFLFFVTICARERGTSPLLLIASDLIESARHYHEQGRWYISLILVMPDHVHALIRFPREAILAATVRNWKRWTARVLGARWQDGFFDHRVRHEESLGDKARYILENPVRAGLVANPGDWPHVHITR